MVSHSLQIFDFILHTFVNDIITPHAHTDDDEDLESDEDRRARMSKETLYDDVLSKFQEYEEYKTQQAEKSKQKKEVSAQLVRAGHPSTTAALGRMAAQMAAEADEQQENNDEGAADDASPKKKIRYNRKAETMSLALAPICACLNESVQANRDLAEAESKRIEKQTKFENKMNAIFAAAAAKSANLPIDVKTILDLVDLTNA